MVRKPREKKHPPPPTGIGEGGQYGDCCEVQARNSVLGGIPKVTIADSSLRYTIGLNVRLRRRTCLFNIEHLGDGGFER